MGLDWLVGAPIAVGALVYVMQPLLTRFLRIRGFRLSAGVCLLTAVLCLDLARRLPQSAAGAFWSQHWVLSTAGRPMLVFIFLVTAILLLAASATAEGAFFCGPALTSAGMLSAVILLQPLGLAFVLLPAALAVLVLAVSDSASDTRGPYGYLGIVSLPIPFALAAFALLQRVSLFPDDATLLGQSALLIAPCAILWLMLFPFQGAMRLWAQRAGAFAPAFLWTVKDAVVVYLLCALWRQYPAMRTEAVTTILGIAGVATAVTSGVWAGAQSNPAALLACAAMSELGIVVHGLMVGTARGTGGALFLLVSRSVAVLLCTCALSPMPNRPARSTSPPPAGWLLETALRWVAFVLGILALSGIPPLAGFVGRRTISAALPPTSSSILLAWRAASLGILFGLVRVGWTWWRRPSEAGPREVRIPSLLLTLALLSCALWLALRPQPLLTLLSTLSGGWLKPPLL